MDMIPRYLIREIPLLRIIRLVNWIFKQLVLSLTNDGRRSILKNFGFSVIMQGLSDLFGDVSSSIDSATHKLSQAAFTMVRKT